MNIGYACLTLGVPNADFRSCTQKNASEEKLVELIAHNLNALETVIDYNIKNQIKLFRISSDLIPFGSSPVNKLPWWDLFETQFGVIGQKIKSAGLRVSMHPGQYTVLNSPDENVVERAIEDLNYHVRILDALGTDASNKIILHIGGVYQNKTLAMERFENNYSGLNDGIKRRLVIENDDRSYWISEVLELGEHLQIPVVFDNLHHFLNHGALELDEAYWIGECSKTWNAWDGRQKIHYSQQEPLKRAGSHSQTIRTEEFLSFYNRIKSKDLDIMLEVKDKNLSAVKCLNLLAEKKEIKALELEWSRYKYSVLEHSPAEYNEIRRLLRDKSNYPALEFYGILESALKKECKVGTAINAAHHIWGYFRDKATETEKNSFLKCAEECRQGTASIAKLKRFLEKMTEKYKEPYLLNSYYFILD